MPIQFTHTARLNLPQSFIPTLTKKGRVAPVHFYMEKNAQIILR
jgi:hypothetical protein